MTTSWIWPDDAGGVNGVTIDVERGKLLWIDDAAACACGDSAVEQTAVAFRRDGPAFSNLPDNVLAELSDMLIKIHR